MRIKDKLHGIEIVDKERPIKDINFILRNDAPDALLVIDKGKITGIVTDSDLVMKINKKNLNSDNIRVKDIMTSPVISIESSRDIKDAIDLMARKKIQKLLVTENGSPIGVLFGEEILELDEEKWKEIVFEQTIEEVYKMLISDPSMEIDTVNYEIREMDKFTNMESKVEFDLFVYQKGLILVAYNYIKDNPNKSLAVIKEDIREHYSELLSEYSQKE